MVFENVIACYTIFLFGVCSTDTTNSRETLYARMYGARRWLFVISQDVRREDVFLVDRRRTEKERKKMSNEKRHGFNTVYGFPCTSSLLSSGASMNYFYENIISTVTCLKTKYNSLKRCVLATRPLVISYTGAVRDRHTSLVPRASMAFIFYINNTISRQTMRA